jgi:hypothetical protein
MRRLEGLGRGLRGLGAGNFGPLVPAVITIVSVSTQESDGDVPVNYTIDKNDATVECVVFAAASPDPVASDFNGGGAPTYVDQGTVSLTTSGSPINLTITGTFAGSVKLALLPTGGGDGDVVVSSAFTLDTTAPTVSLSPADGATGVLATANIVMTFSEAMKTQGTVDLRVVGGALIESFDLATEGTWSVGDTVWTGNPASDFTAGASLCVRWSGLEDTKGNPLADNTGDTLWNFGVASPPAVVLVGTAWTNRAGTASFTTLTGGIASAPLENDVGLFISSNSSNADRTNDVNPSWTVAEEFLQSGGLEVSVRSKTMGVTPDTSGVMALTGDSADAQNALFVFLRGLDPTIWDAGSAAAAINYTGSSTSASSYTPPSITTATNNALVITGIACRQTGGLAIDIQDPGGFDYLREETFVNGSRSNSIAIGLISRPTAGVYNPPTFSLAGGQTFLQVVGFSIMIKPA